MGRFRFRDGFWRLRRSLTERFFCSSHVHRLTLQTFHDKIFYVRLSILSSRVDINRHGNGATRADALSENSISAFSSARWSGQKNRLKVDRTLLLTPVGLIYYDTQTGIVSPNFFSLLPIFFFCEVFLPKFAFENVADLRQSDPLAGWCEKCVLAARNRRLVR